MAALHDRPVVLLHGCGGSRESTFESTGWLSALSAAGRTARALHLPGHGTHSAAHDPASYADLAGSVMRDVTAGAFDAIGFSLGAKLLLEIAIRAPERIGRLVLGGIGDNVFAPESIAEAAATALERGPTADTPPPVLALLRTWEPERNDPLAIAAVLRRPANPVFTEDRLRRIGSPVLIVNGDADPVAQLGDRLVSSLAHVTCVTLPGVDHLGLPAQPAFIRHAVEFLGSASA
jgi:pimeloyl-ACP methyl ester carboxylesterase